MELMPLMQPSSLPFSAALEKQREEYVEMLRAGHLPSDRLPAVARSVEEAVLARAWEHVGRPGNGSRLYVLSVMGTHPRVKVGQGDARGRIARHRNEYHVNGHGLVDAWISVPLASARMAERALLAIAKWNSSPPGYRREEYPNADFGEFREAARFTVLQLKQENYDLHNAERS